MSSQPWQDLRPTLSQAKPPCTRLAEAVPKKPTVPESIEQAFEVDDGFKDTSCHADASDRAEVEKDRGSVSAEGPGKRCFLCGDADHAVFECAQARCGLAIDCSVLAKLSPKKRWDAFQAACRKATLPSAESVRWYMKTEKAGVLYARFASEEDAEQVFKAKDFEIDGHPTKRFKVSEPRKRGRPAEAEHGAGSKTSGAAKKRRAATPTPSASSTAGGDDGTSIAASAGNSRQGNSSERNLSGQCLLCGSRDHLIYGCPYTRQSICIMGLEESKSKGLEEFFKQCQADFKSVPRWCGRKCYVQLESSRLVKRLSSRSTCRSLVLNGQRLHVYPVKGAQAQVEPVFLDERGKEKGKENKESEECHLCGARDHDSKECPDSSHCLWSPAVGQPLSSQEYESAFRTTLETHGAPLKRLRWVGKRCYLCFNDPEKTMEILKLACAQGGLEPAENSGLRKRMRLFPPSSDAQISEDTITPARKLCFVCGEPGHEIPLCPYRSQSVLVCREWGSNDPNVSGAEMARRLQAIKVATTEALSAAGYTVRRSRWHKAVCYVMLENESQAKQLLAAASPPNGLKVRGEVLQVRPVRSTRVMCSDKDDDGDVQLADAGASAEELPCALCQEMGHAPHECAKGPRSVVVRCSVLQVEEMESDAAWAACFAGVPTPECVRVQGDAFYWTFASKDDAQKLIEVAAGEGLEIKGELASVQGLHPPLQEGDSKERSAEVQELAGLRPKSHHERQRGKGRGKAHTKHEGGRGRGGKGKKRPNASR